MSLCDNLFGTILDGYEKLVVRGRLEVCDQRVVEKSQQSFYFREDGQWLSLLAGRVQCRVAGASLVAGKAPGQRSAANLAA